MPERVARLPASDGSGAAAAARLRVHGDGAALRAPAVFLDKDGTLVENIPYNIDPALLRFTPNALAGLALLAQAGLRLVLVSNQPGLAHGRFSAIEFARLREALLQRLRDEAGVELAGVYVCPHAPDRNGRPACACRKPMPGLLRRAALELGLDLRRSWMVGDILDDVEAGRRAGCHSLLMDVGNETVWERGPLREPRHVVGDLLQAAQRIVESQVLLPRPDGESLLLPRPFPEGKGARHLSPAGKVAGQQPSLQPELCSEARS